MTGIEMKADTVREYDVVGKSEAENGAEMREADIVVIGGGPAGMAAAIEAYRSGIKNIVILERDRALGGILQQCVHNGFGLQLYKEELTGPEYAERFIRQVGELGIEVRLNTMVFDISRDKVISAVNCEDGLIKIKAKAIILSMGCRERTRGALNIPGTRPAGIYTAGTAQRFVNVEGYMPGKKVVILGSGDIGLIMARRMTLEGAEVKMVCELMPYSGGLKRNIVQCLEDFGIPLKLSHTVVEIHGKNRLEGVTIARVDERGKPVAGTYEFVECDTLLLSVGLIPENELSKGVSIDMDPTTSGPVVDESCETSAEGIFACGNVVYVHDLVDHVTTEGYRAGKSAASYVKKKYGSTGRSGDMSAGYQQDVSPESADTGINSGHPEDGGPGAGSMSMNNGHQEDKVPEAGRIDLIRVISGDGVRCVIPQLIHRDFGEDVTLFFRVGGIRRNVRIEARSGGKVLHSRKRNIVTPGEMESLTIGRSAIGSIESGTIEICVSES